MDERCNATAELADDRTIVCVLPAGHPGPVHKDDQGEAWGDQNLLDAGDEG